MTQLQNVPYQEGSWTPTLTFSNPGDLSVIYRIQEGHFTRVGRMVAVDFFLFTAGFSWTTSIGFVKLDGLPSDLPGVQGYDWSGTMTWSGITLGEYSECIPVYQGPNDFLRLQANASGHPTRSVEAADLPSGAEIVLAGTVTYLLG